MTQVSSPQSRKSAKFEAYPIHPRSSQAFVDHKPCSPVLAAHCCLQLRSSIYCCLPSPAKSFCQCFCPSAYEWCASWTHHEGLSRTRPDRLSSITRAAMSSTSSTPFKGFQPTEATNHASIKLLPRTHSPNRVANVVVKPRSSLPHPICQHWSTTAIVAATLPRCNNTCWPKKNPAVAQSICLLCHKLRIMTQVSSPQS